MNRPSFHARPTHALLLLVATVFVVARFIDAPSAHAAGPLDPPAGPVAPTPGPEPRTPISATTTPGDANNLYRITLPGSYYLTGNINAASKSAIAVAADNVTIDLAGFTITGTGSTPSTGIVSSGSLRRALVVRNGNINSFNGYGLSGDFRDSRFEDLAFNANKLGSLEIFQSLDCIASRIRVTAGIGEAGIQFLGSARIEDCIVDGGHSGIFVGSNSVVTGCVVSNQSSTGIKISGGLVENCSVHTTTGSSSYSDAGIYAGAGTAVRACSIRNVITAGVFIDGASSVENCLISQCAKGIASSQFSGGSMRIEGNEFNDCTGTAIDLPFGKHMVIGNRLRGNAANINANASVVLGEVVICGPGALPAAAANPTANLVW